MSTQLIVINPRGISSSFTGVGITPKLIEIQPTLIKVKPVGVNVSPTGKPLAPTHRSIHLLSYRTSASARRMSAQSGVQEKDLHAGMARLELPSCCTLHMPDRFHLCAQASRSSPSSSTLDPRCLCLTQQHPPPRHLLPAATKCSVGWCILARRAGNKLRLWDGFPSHKLR